MNEQDKRQEEQTIPAESMSYCGKRVYIKPVLTTFGEVRLLTGNGSGSGTDAMGAPGMSMTSDSRCKQGLVRIGSHPQGFGLYLYTYKPGFGPGSETGQRCFGVLAQEVAEIVPAAVSTAANGYLQVDYHMLGIYPVLH